jgi:hypothetical protein
MKLDDNAVATLAKVSDLIEQWHKEALDRYAWEVNYDRREDMRVRITARAVREQLERPRYSFLTAVTARSTIARISGVFPGFHSSLAFIRSRPESIPADS